MGPPPPPPPPVACSHPKPRPPPTPCPPPQECHNIVKRAWAKTTRTFNRTQQKRRPSYCLRQSSGAGRKGEGERCAANMAAVAAAAAEVDGEGTELPPPAAQHLALMRC